MGKHLQKLFSFRTDEELINKLNYIANHNSRTRNKEVEHVLKNYVKDFEATHGELVVEEDGSVSTAKPKALPGKSSTSKIG